MKTKKIAPGSAVPLILILFLFTGCAAKKNIWGDPDKGLTLEYRMPDKVQLTYGISSDYIQSMEVMGQNIEMTSESRNLFTMEPAGKKSGNHTMNVTVDTAYILIKTQQGELIPEMDQVIGKPFMMVVSPLGRELDCSGAAELKYKLGPSEELDISSDFKTLFPDLPGKPVVVGDSWNTTDTVVEKGSSGYLELVTRRAHLVEGIEHVEGYACVRVKSTFTGTLNGSGSMQGLQTKTTGTFEGEDTWYFAFKEGLFVKLISSGQAITTTEAKGQNRDIVIPGKRDFEIVTGLVL